MNTQTAANPTVVYWHRDLPPLAADVMGEYVVEASSGRVSSMLAHRDRLWTRCHAGLMAQAHDRLEQEVARLGGRYAHVLNESIDPHHDAATGEAWLQGRFTYVLYR
jgi:hypothetical protein